MRADRLLSLLMLLQNRGRMTAPELAAELEVSVRTVYRDIEALGASGVPVLAERGPAGGYALMDGYRTRLTGLSEAEAASLFLVGAPGPARDLGLGMVLATARRKLEAALPGGSGEHARRVRERFHLDAPGWFRDADEVPQLETVAGAVWDQRVLRVHYRSWSAETHREIHPLGIVLKGGIWYLVARTAAPDGDARTYRVSRFLAAEHTGERFARPPEFDLTAYWEAASRRLTSALHQHTAHLRVSPRGRRLLPVRFGTPATRALNEAGPPDDDGWRHVHLPVESLPVAVSDLLWLGPEAETLGPPDLREAVTEAVRVLAGWYGVPGAGAD
ncbi:WYL domain-containing protein [Streptomyces sp. HNM0574]|uniref:helix-turn-helix transcriptional regulator n=1 Tax=Streptomyces sp. HNM0574 TaxID=2714954 RepID=UPI00146B21D6|nr:WYL domain-containing protein [Streptomyces sp. HNM0574]NLU65925.1 WYL domain-containing protein [Streptomyces sp. HNM0574]